MAKKSQKKLKKENAGCMSGIISMFDFRHGRYTQRLLSDKKMGVAINSKNKFDVLSDMEEMNEDVIDTHTQNVGRTKASIKALMAEEMSKTHTSKNIRTSIVEQLISEMGIEYDLKKNQEATNQHLKVESGNDVNPSNCEFQIKHIESNRNGENSSILQKALSDITEALLAQKSINSKETVSSVEVQTKEFMDALEILNSNKDLFLKLLQDPNSILFKQVIDFQNTHGEILNGSQPEKNSHRIFRKKDKPEESSSQSLKRIVVLKPRPSTAISPISSPKSLNGIKNQESASHFSIKDIKRRLKNMIGESKKKRDLIAMDGVLHKIPYGSQNSEENNKSPKFSTFLKNGNKNDNLKQKKPTISNPLYRESIFYEEAKKRLAEMINLDAQYEVSSPRRVSKSLGRVLSLSDYNTLSPVFSPIRDKDVSQKSNQEDSTCNGLSTWNIDSSSCDGPDKAHLRDEDDLTQIESNSIEECDQSNVLVEFNTDEHGCISDGCNEENSSTDSVVGPSEEMPPITPCISISNLEESSGKATENIDRPSPVSVLEPFFSEDNDSPERRKTTDADLIKEPRQLIFDGCDNSQLDTTPATAEANPRLRTDDKETKFNYIRAVLEASGLNYNKDLDKWQSSDQLLDPFVFDEVEIVYDQLIDDSKLLFDCINEVLIEMKNRYLICSPWISIIKSNIRPIPVGENFVHEVRKGVAKHLDIVSPYTLEMVIKKDLEFGPWINVWLESEGAVFDIGEVILEYIMEETILELWD